MQGSLTEQQNENNFTYMTPLSNFKRLIEPELAEKFQIIISPSNIKKQIPIFNKEKCYQRKIQITLNEARVISRRINDLYQVDPTINNYEILIPKEEIEEANEIIDLLIQSTQKEIEIPKEKEKIFSRIRQFLGENDETSQIQIESQEEAISLLNTNYHNLSLQYFGNHFMKLIESGETKNFSETILSDIIDCYFKAHKKELKRDEAIQIFNKLKSENENDKIVMHFLVQIDIDEYDESMLKYFYDHLDNNIIKNNATQVIYILKKFISTLVGNHLKMKPNPISTITPTTPPTNKINNNNSCIFNSLSKSKFKITRNSSEKKFPSNIIECKFKGNELSGIIQYLEKTFGEDLENNNVLRITGGGFPNSSCPITNLIKYDKNSINNFYYNYSSQDPKSENDAWIQFDFGKRRINLSSYTIRACCHDTANECKAKSWRIVGSNDGQNWDILDHQVDRSELKDKYSEHIFNCEKNDKYYRYIRYIQEETWYTNDNCKYYIHFSCIELFGTILESPIPCMNISLTNNSYS